ncbi:hypothetical protein [Prosthecobacter vanneervenii]|uniref:Uncharacterized protein n=1 Tax=Prosthecobacter vanneervenii TaxID=48466 RepID=A0A7W7YE98_9BACT|nr:hypothetical protein [Prosthecobacter vanneervenii]MBB5034591.1 hypothetical protein [Prosthecobacter vanneervenii]
MKCPNLASITLTVSVLLAVSCSHVPDETGSHNGRPVAARSSHPSGAATAPAKGTYLGRRYFTPPGSKGGLQWTDVYAQ